jgi:hypothetical protein
MNQLFETLINSSVNAGDAYMKLWKSTCGFNLMSVNDIMNVQRHYLYNAQSVTTTKLIEFLCLEGKLPLYDPILIQAIFNRDKVLYMNLWKNAITNLIYFDICNYENAIMDTNEIMFLVGMVENRDELADYIESSINNWVDQNECILTLNSDIRDIFTKHHAPNTTIVGTTNGSIADEIKNIIKEGFMQTEFTIKSKDMPLNLIRNPQLHSDMMYYLSGLHQYYNSLLFKHPYYYSVEEFINNVLDDIELGIYYGVLEYYLDDNERKISYDKETDALIYVYLTSCINKLGR